MAGAWQGPDNTINAGRTITPAEFESYRQQGEATRQGVNLENGEVKSVEAMILHNLGPVAGISLEGARALAKYLVGIYDRLDKAEAQVQELRNQLTLLRGLPPFMANVEQR